MSKEHHIERHILIGLITSTEFLDRIRQSWDPSLLQSSLVQRLAGWCVEYYDKYGKAPNRDIEGIYFEKLQHGLDQDLAEEIEEDILPDLSDEYEREGFNVQYLMDRASEYLNRRHLETWSKRIQDLTDAGETLEAEKLANNFKPLAKELDGSLNLSEPNSLDRVREAFTTALQPLVTYPGALGQFWNAQLTRDALVAFMAPEKRGKSYLLLDLARRSVRQRLNVAFFQAGDMSESQQIRRLGIHLAKKSDREEYCGKMWEPVRDCIHNQLDDCDLDVRECFQGLYGDHAPKTAKEAREELTKENLVELYKEPENKRYKPCHNCKKYQLKENRWGCTWLKRVNVGQPLEAEEAVRIFENYFVKNKRRFMLSTHPNNTLSIGQIRTTLDIWYKQGFVPDVIIIDYADLLVSDEKEFRHKQDAIWKGLRSLSEERHCLVVTATQADATSYERNLLTMSNFSEDKRKNAHVTAMYGLNQDPRGREKDIGILRINELVIREGAPQGVVHVLQNLRRGQPVLTSYW